jgi:hypothetical protein
MMHHEHAMNWEDNVEYLLLICGEEPEAGAEVEPSEGMLAETEAWVEEMTARGVRKFGERLRLPSNATTVRVREGEVLLSDGPFAETKEAVMGFDLIECTDLDEAIEVAAKHPMAKAGSIEVRPLWPLGL